MRGPGWVILARRLRNVQLSIVVAVAMVLLVLLVMRATEPAAAQPVAVGFVTDEAGLTDGGFNWFSYQGLLRAQQELGVSGTVYTSTSSADYLPNLQQCVQDGNRLCLSVGFMTADAISTTAAASSDTAFAIVDYSWQSYPENLRGITFASEEAGYLAGTLAGLMTQSDVVGCAAAMQIPPVEASVEPYRNAAQCANPGVTTIVTYTGTFEDFEGGMMVADEMISKGADVVFGVGGATGNGAVLWATQLGAWGIGVDTDAYVALFGNGAVPGSDRVLSSAMKRMDNAVFGTIADVLSGRFAPGTVIYDAAADGVGLAPFHEADPFVPSTMRGRLERIRQDIMAGIIDVHGVCPQYMDATTAVLSPTATMVLTGSGGLVTVAFPTGAFTGTVDVTYAPQVPFDPGPSLAGVGLFYELGATSQSTGQPVQPQGTFTMTVSYSDEEVEAGQLVDEDGLGFYWWDGDQWVRESSSEVDTTANQIVAMPDHLSLWAVLSEKHRLFLPVVSKNR